MESGVPLCGLGANTALRERNKKQVIAKMTGIANHTVRGQVNVEKSL
jgi:hypothetical protein